MTLEICILRKDAIAVAVDSAGTIAKTKTVTPFPKLFVLNDNVNIIETIYGASDYGGIPFENLIATFKNETDFTKVNSILSIKEEFLKYIEKKTENHDFKKDFKIRLEFFKKNIESYNEVKISPKEPDDAVKALKEYRDYDEFFKNIRSDVNWVDLKKYFFNTLPITGIVFVGFSQNDNYPSCVNTKFIHGTKPIIILNEELLNVHENMIKTFAQDDMVHSILKGQHESIDKLNQYGIEMFSNRLITKIKDDILSSPNIDDDSMKYVENILLKYENELSEEIENFNSTIQKVKSRYSTKTIKSLSFLSKERLCELARTLIEITALKKEASKNLNTVGGEITVVLITQLNGIEFQKK